VIFGSYTFNETSLQSLHIQTDNVNPQTSENMWTESLFQVCNGQKLLLNAKFNKRMD